MYSFHDHSACTSLLNTPHPSAKLARWAMTIQEMDLHIQHRPDKSNVNADALSRNPPVQDTEPNKAKMLSVTSTNIEEKENSTKDQTESPHMEIANKEISNLQHKEPDLHCRITLLERGELPANEKLAKKLVLEQDQCNMIDGILHHENPANPGCWRIVVPKSLQQEVLEEAYSGRFAGHFAERRVYETLRKTYWWRGMRADVRRHCRSCLTCATRKGTG